ncbi:hypothetical protein [uncultured Rikenella sp.]|uniref:hypothetical protein n=1 Tax=uncultured Rikenella sp. TaxID=368003 RepID=UPI00262CA596|nr:hypothetical protein [uncultured Rikenella sp.]
MPSGTAPGFRDAGDYGRLGGVVNVGGSGYSWSVATNSIHSIFLAFDPPYLYPGYAYFRGLGLQLRCLSE